jgi:transcriptional regulator GlxA family with amidase domain
VSPFEVGVACDVFGGEYYAQEFGVPWYQLTVCAATPSVRLDAGLRMEVPAGLDAVGSAATVVVVPTEQPDQVPAAVLDALRAARARGQRIPSLCTGAFILAAAGILDGHRATTHWSECAALAGRYPRVTVDPTCSTWTKVTCSPRRAARPASTCACRDAFRAH